MIRRLCTALLLGASLVLAIRPAHAQRTAATVEWSAQGTSSGSSSSGGSLPVIGDLLPDLALRSSTVRSPVTKDRAFSVRFAIGEREALHVTTGYTRIVSAPDVFWNTLPAKATWKFKAVPITVGYERALAARERRLVPTIGAGLTVYFTRMKRLESPHGASAVVDRPGFIYSHASPSFAYGYGTGFGGQATLGLRFSLTSEFFLLSQARVRYVDGLAFSGNRPDARFVCVDFIAGVGVEL